MIITGAGTGINELTALAGTAELVPLSRRGYYIAGMVLTVLPFMPSAMYAQMIAYHSTWRYISIVTAGWTFLGLVLTLLYYFPPPLVKPREWKAKMQLLKRTDFVGGMLSIVGLASFETGILGGGYEVSLIPSSWVSPPILSLLTSFSFRGRAQTRWYRWCLGSASSLPSWCGSEWAPNIR
jgi:hypothetical protein